MRITTTTYGRKEIRKSLKNRKNYSVIWYLALFILGFITGYLIWG